jgi:FkbM family methyltransferase
MNLLKLQLRAQRYLGRYLAEHLRFDTTSRSRRDTSVEMVTLGSEIGSWTIPDNMLSPDSICYCFGCGEDITFDLELIDRFRCDVYAFDPTERAIQHVRNVAEAIDAYHFFELGLWDENTKLRFFAPVNSGNVSHSALNLQGTSTYFEADVKRLNSIMQDNGHDRIDLLKIDIEGAEYKAIESIVQDRIPISVLCVEFDECFNPLDSDFRSRIVRSIESLNEVGYNIVHSSGDGNLTFMDRNSSAYGRVSSNADIVG